MFMKKFYPLCALLPILGICSLLVPSCSPDDDTPTPGPSDNSFVYDGAQSKIESVVYTVDEQKVYTFYFSPTQGLVDLDAMLLADDYVKIVTATPTGAIDLLSGGNQLLYKKLNISSATGDNVEKATLSLQLTSLTTAKMSLDAVTKDGETLRAEYNGLCIKYTENQGDVYDVTLTDQIFGYYRGAKEDAGTNEYYIALTNAQYETGGGTQFTPKSEGYVLMLDFYGTSGATWKDIPTGIFSESEHFEDHTYFSNYSFLAYYDADGRRTDYQLVDAVKIERDEAGNATVTATFLDGNYEDQTLIYTGELKMGDGTLNVRLPQLERDITIEGAYASAIYDGDVFENGTGLMEITIIDEKGDNEEPNGSAMKIALFGPKFTDPKRNCVLVAGTYTAADTYAQGTWMSPIETDYMGMVIPLGTYGLYDDGTQTGLYAYGASGDIVIRDGSNPNTYTIEWELQSIAGYSIQGSYTGEIYIEDQSSDDKDDGSSNLDNDYELNLSYLTRGDCYPQTEIWVRNLGTIPVSEAWGYSEGRKYGFQHIDVGTSGGTYEVTEEYPIGGGWNGKGKGKLIEGDFIGIDLLVPEGMESQIFPGTYPIVANRFPAYFQPGVCIPGYLTDYLVNGTYMARTVSAIGNGFPDGYYDPDYTVINGWLNIPTIGKFASIYSGTVTVTKAAGGENQFTFTIDGRDVRKHRITGSWTGPVYLGGTDTPVQAGTITQAAAKQRTPSFRELQSRNGGKLPFLMSRQIYR